MPAAAVVLVLIESAHAILFPSSPGCSCVPCAPQHVCPALPTCPPVQRCLVLETQCCSTCPCKKTKRVKREVDESSSSVYVVDYNGTTPINTNIDRVTSIAKRRIQDECQRRLQGRYNVICARGDFSYITNTEEFCQQSVGDVTCYVFKQLSDVIRARLS